MKITLWIATALLTLTILFYAVENWRGARAWSHTKEYLEGEGETLDFSELRPKPVPPAENVFGTPLLASLSDFTLTEPDREVEYNDEETRNRFLEMQLPEVPANPKMARLPDLDESGLTDLSPWAALLSEAAEFDAGDSSAPPAVQIRRAFARFDADFSEIAEAAANRPQAWIPVHFGDGFVETIAAQLPHITDLMNFSKFLTLKAVAALAEGDTATAKACVQIQLRLAEAAGAEPVLIHHLVEVAILSKATAIIREGLLRRGWNGEDLDWIRSRLGAIDLYEHGTNALRGEMTGFFLAGTEFLKSAGPQEWALLTGDTPDMPQMLAQGLLPAGWLNQNAAIGCDLLYHNGILPLKNRNFSSINDNFLAQRLRSTTPYNFLARKLIPATSMLTRKTVRIQVMLDAARVACALEQFHLQNQAYPATLDSLIPDFLPSIPSDPITKGPLLFKPDENGYRLYSVGLNGKDEGGALFRKASGKVDRDKGDWVFSCQREGS